MSRLSRQPKPLAFKPDLEDAARRWDAFYAGDLIDRPIVCVRAPKPGHSRMPRRISYREMVFAEIEAIIDRALENAAAIFWGGEAMPVFYPTLGPDEIAVYCGASLEWSADSDNTNWSVPFVEDWGQALPLTLKPESPLWQRTLAFYRRAVQRMSGQMLLASLDLHTNFDLLAAVRGANRLCMDVIDQPEAIDRAMQDARSIFRDIWQAISLAGRMDENGYCDVLYSMEGAAILQSDHSCLIGSEMFRRWVLPALEEEAEIVEHAIYHWDGPMALKHAEDLIASRGLLALDYVPGAGRGSIVEYLDLLKRVQTGGKAVSVWVSADEAKVLHKELLPNKVIYNVTAESEAAAERLLDWFTAHT